MAGEELSRLAVRATIQEAEAELRACGVRRLALFGSVARGEAGPHSDIDLLVQFEPQKKTYDSFLRVSALLH
jgi:predicted nucleotidyltransferase